MRDFTILEGNSLDVLKTLPDNSVHVCVTSPPYFGLRSYHSPDQVWPAVSYKPMPGLSEISFPCDPECKHEWGKDLRLITPQKGNYKNSPYSTSSLTNPERQDLFSRDSKAGNYCQDCGAWRGSLGQEPTPEMYVAHLVLICREIRRVLRKDGTFWLNLGDSSVGSTSDYDQYGSLGKNSRVVPGGDKVSGLPLNGLRERNKGMRAGGLKPKDLVGVPWRVAFALQAEGWWLRQDNIWHKPNVLPRSVTDNTTLDYEHVFMFAKSRKYWFDQDSIREPHTMKPQRRLTPRYNHPKGDSGRPPHMKPEYSEELSKEPGVNGHPGGRNKRAVWTVTTKASNWDFCKACSTLLVGRERQQIVKEKYTDEEGKTRVRLHCPCGAHDQWESHFATYPADLVEPCVMAGISPGGCCKKCGTPYRRVTRRTTEFGGGSGKAGRTPEEMNHSGKWADQQYGKNIKLGPMLRVETLGFEPSCGCVSESDLCVVLDPFAGSGTTGIVAVREGAKFIGIEINPVYAEIARQRIDKETRVQQRSLF